MGVWPHILHTADESGICHGQRTNMGHVLQVCFKRCKAVFGYFA
jgi:hypothetical protein